MASEQGHTPGPWIAEEHYGRTTRLRVRTADNAATICQVTALVHKQANARLIAAAPDLLAALTDCVNAMHADNPADGWLEIIQRARAAIAKATA